MDSPSGLVHFLFFLLVLAYSKLHEKNRVITCLPVYLSHELEVVQKTAMRIIFQCFMYDETLVKVSLVTLSDRRQALTDKLFKKILDNKDSKLRNLLPPQNA